MINSRVKVQYWANDRMISPSDNVLLYPNGSDVVSQVHIFDADWTDALLDGLDPAWNFANGVLSATENNLLSAGFSALDLGRSVNDLKNDLSDKVGARVATLAIAYPNELFNTIHVVFEAEGEGDLKSPAASPPTNPPLCRCDLSKNAGKHQRAEYIINLDQLRAKMGDDRFYGSPGRLQTRPGIAFAFADEEDDEVITLSVLQILSIFFHSRGQLQPLVTTDIYYLRADDPVEPGSLVEVQRLMQYTRAIQERAPDSEDAWQAISVPLERFSDGIYRINGKPYQRIMLWFQVASLRAYDPNLPKIEIIGEVKPENQDILRPQIWQPVPFLTTDRFGQGYQAEGSGSAITPPFSPSDLPPGTHKVFFIANQDSNWNSAQVVDFMPVSIPPTHPPIALSRHQGEDA